MTKHVEHCSPNESSGKSDADISIGNAACDAYTKSGQSLFKMATSSSDNSADKVLPNFGINFDNNNIGNNNEISITNNITKGPDSKDLACNTAEVKNNTTELKDVSTDLKDNTTELKDVSTNLKDNTTDLKDVSTNLKDNTSELKNNTTAITNDTASDDKLANSMDHLDQTLEGFMQYIENASQSQFSNNGQNLDAAPMIRTSFDPFSQSQNSNNSWDPFSSSGFDNSQNSNPTSNPSTPLDFFSGVQNSFTNSPSDQNNAQQQDNQLGNFFNPFQMLSHLPKPPGLNGLPGMSSGGPSELPEPPRPPVPGLPGPFGLPGFPGPGLPKPPSPSELIDDLNPANAIKNIGHLFGF